MSYLCERGISSLGHGCRHHGCGHRQQGGGRKEAWRGQVVQGVGIQPALKLLHAPVEVQKSVYTAPSRLLIGKTANSVNINGKCKQISDCSTVAIPLALSLLPLYALEQLMGLWLLLCRCVCDIQEGFLRLVRLQIVEQPLYEGLTGGWGTSRTKPEDEGGRQGEVWGKGKNKQGRIVIFIVQLF